MNSLFHHFIVKFGLRLDYMTAQYKLSVNAREQVEVCLSFLLSKITFFQPL